MYLIVNEIELTVSNAYTERDADTGVLSAVIEVPYTSMEFAELKTLFAANTGIITKVLDNGMTESWDGFTYSKPPVDDGTQYRIILIGEESVYQLERTRHLEKTVAQKEASILDLKSQIEQKDKEIADLARQYTDMLYNTSLEEIREAD